MRFQTPLIPARLLRRYKRFLADMELGDGQQVTVHCPNPGAMTGLAEPGQLCWLEPNSDPRRKLSHGWRLTALKGGHLANIDTSLPNRVVAEALRAGLVQGLESYATIRPEVRHGAASRIDFLLSGSDLPDALVEVKSVTLRRGDLGAFPDCVTARGSRHLAELTAAVGQGRRAVMLFLVGRTDCTGMTVAADIDPAYAAAFDVARAAGVEMRAHGCRITTEGIEFSGPLPVVPGLRG